MTDKDPNEEDTPNPLSPEEQAVFDDLRAYDNPEVFYNPDLPKTYKLRITPKPLPDNPTIFSVEINGDVLVSALVESMFSLLRKAPENQDLDDAAFARVRAEAENEPDFDDIVNEVWLFFVRHFPKILVRAYGIAAITSITGSMISKWRQDPDERLNEAEKLARTTLESLTSGLEKDLKQWVEIRSKGRPPKIKHEANSAPEIARTVWRIACEIMGDARGADAVPLLKQIALVLDTSPEALSKQLGRASWPWSEMKEHLAKRT